MLSTSWDWAIGLDGKTFLGYWIKDVLQMFKEMDAQMYCAAALAVYDEATAAFLESEQDTLMYLKKSTLYKKGSVRSADLALLISAYKEKQGTWDPGFLEFCSRIQSRNK